MVVLGYFPAVHPVQLSRQSAPKKCTFRKPPPDIAFRGCYYPAQRNGLAAHDTHPPIRRSELSDATDTVNQLLTVAVEGDASTESPDMAGADTQHHRQPRPTTALF